MSRKLLQAALVVLAIGAGLAAPAAFASRLADVTVYDRTSGRDLPVYRHRGRLYVAGEPGHEYEIHVRNRGPGRVLAVGSVDGVNVISGATADPGQSGYVIDSYDTLQVDGWRKSMGQVAAFYFTALPDSYAARTGRPYDVGVIGVALYRERPRPEWRSEWPMTRQEEDRARSGKPSPAPAAPGSAAEPESSRGAAADSAAPRANEKLGTGHGQRYDSHAQYVEFERATERPEEVIAIYYDSRRNLVAQGVIRPDRRYAARRPNPFPGGFVPDP